MARKLGKVREGSDLDSKQWESGDGSIRHVTEMAKPHLINAYHYAGRACAFMEVEHNFEMESRKWKKWRKVFKEELDRRGLEY